ncbi:MAG TPA: type II toxin-antitoxin system YoeB family toxin [Pseudonocardiaceae bacterium]|nr:type II toxin-antitoxin system YoeB family toxin [Pseudonocardiaceae bacterium]
MTSRSDSRLGRQAQDRRILRINDGHRLIYKVAETEIRIAACRYHYGK